jgi:hypothetical protein
MRKIFVLDQTGMYTTASGVDIPIRTMTGPFGSISEAADWISRYCGVGNGYIMDRSVDQVAEMLFEKEKRSDRSRSQ